MTSKPREPLCRKVTVLTEEKGPVDVVLRKGPHGGVLSRAELESPLSKWSWNDLHGAQDDMRYARIHLEELGLKVKEEVKRGVKE